MRNSKIDMTKLFSPLEKEEAKTLNNFTPLMEKNKNNVMFQGSPGRIKIAKIADSVKMGVKNKEADVEILRRIAAACLNYVEDPGLEEHGFDRRAVDVRLNNVLKKALGTPDSPVQIYPGDFFNQVLDRLAMKNAVYVWEAEENACEECREKDGEIFQTEPFPQHPNCKYRFSLLLPPPGGQREGMLFEKISGGYFVLPWHLYEKQNPNLKVKEGRVFRQLNPKAEDQLLDYMIRTMTNPRIRKDFESVIKHWADFKGMMNFESYVTDNGRYDGRIDVRKIIAGRYRVINKKGHLVPVTNYMDETGPAFVFPMEGVQALVDYDVVWNFLFGYFAHLAGVTEFLGLLGSSANDATKNRWFGTEDYPAVKAGYKMAEKGYPISKEVIRHLLLSRPVNLHE